MTLDELLALRTRVQQAWGPFERAQKSTRGNARTRRKLRRKTVRVWHAAMSEFNRAFYAATTPQAVKDAILKIAHDEMLAARAAKVA